MTAAGTRPRFFAPHRAPLRRRSPAARATTFAERTLSIEATIDPPADLRELPEPYTTVRVGGARLYVLPRVAGVAETAIAAAGSLYAFAKAHPDRQPLPSGRGPIFRVPMAPGDWVVRRYRRGGWMRWLGDRYLRVGRARPLAELETSVQVRHRGVPTPEVLAAAVYPTGAVYRGDLVTAYIPESYDLATLLFGPSPLEGEERAVAWAEAGRLLRWLYSLGVIHRDLNLGNILLERCIRPPRPYVLDLDRCTTVDHVGPEARRRMLRRFRRSVDKMSERMRRPVTREEWHAFQAAYRTKRV